MPINLTSTICRRKSNAAIKLHAAFTVSIADQLQLLSMRGSGKIGIESRERQALTTGEFKVTGVIDGESVPPSEHQNVVFIRLAINHHAEAGQAAQKG